MTDDYSNDSIPSHAVEASRHETVSCTATAHEFDSDSVEILSVYHGACEIEGTCKNCGSTFYSEVTISDMSVVE